MNTLRCGRLARLLEQNGLDSAVTCDPSDIFYFTGMRTDGAYLLFNRGGARLFLNSLYPCKKKWTVPVAELKNIKLGKTGIEPSKISVSSLSALKKMTGCTVIKKEPLFAKIRALKEPGEIKKIDTAQKISKRLCSGVRLTEGMSERDVASYISARAHSLSGGPAFEPIVAFGANGASPHHIPSGKKYSRHALALIDMGVIYKDYRADLTRMKGLFNIKTLLGRAYAAVNKARETALPHIVPGAEIGGIGRMIKKYLADQGFEKNILHSAGHGIGLDVHEWPAINCSEREKFEKGMVFTLEPGLYFSGIGGVRVEDVYVLEDKARVLG
ncbi:MAG: Xaa-Pro peptidase family protein [Elusimicrobiota bacterium]|nr:Xaa-Pro peptidase family protein [Elusimicrobiota bacterium]